MVVARGGWTASTTAGCAKPVALQEVDAKFDRQGNLLFGFHLRPPTGRCTLARASLTKDPSVWGLITDRSNWTYDASASQSAYDRVSTA